MYGWLCSLWHRSLWRCSWLQLVLLVRWLLLRACLRSLWASQQRDSFLCHLRGWLEWVTKLVKTLTHRLCRWRQGRSTWPLFILYFIFSHEKALVAGSILFIAVSWNTPIQLVFLEQILLMHVHRRWSFSPITFHCNVIELEFLPWSWIDSLVRASLGVDWLVDTAIRMLLNMFKLPFRARMKHLDHFWGLRKLRSINTVFGLLALCCAMSLVLLVLSSFYKAWLCVENSTWKLLMHLLRV